MSSSPKAPREAAYLFAFAVTFIAVVSCGEDAVVKPLMPVPPDGTLSTEVTYNDYAPGDSSPQACAMFDCVSLTPEEKAEMLDAASRAIEAAGEANNIECFQLFVGAHGKVSNNYVFKARAYLTDQYGRAITGAYNYGHGDMYIQTDRFASNGDMLNTLSHEAAHSVGYRDSYAPYAQDVTNDCSIYLTPAG